MDYKIRLCVTFIVLLTTYHEHCSISSSYQRVVSTAESALVKCTKFKLKLKEYQARLTSNSTSCSAVVGGGLVELNNILTRNYKVCYITPKLSEPEELIKSLNLSLNLSQQGLEMALKESKDRYFASQCRAIVTTGIIILLIWQSDLFQALFMPDEVDIEIRNSLYNWVIRFLVYPLIINIFSIAGVRERVPDNISLEDVKCPVCYSVMVPPVRNACVNTRQLLAQHPVCNPCLDRLISDGIIGKSCPTCRAPLTPFRCDWATRYLENHVTRCCNFPYCLEAFDRTDEDGILAHVQNCPYRLF